MTEQSINNCNLFAVNMWVRFRSLELSVDPKKLRRSRKRPTDLQPTRRGRRGDGGVVWQVAMVMPALFWSAALGDACSGLN